MAEFIICYRLVSAYEDKSLGLSENGEIFGGIKNKTFKEFIGFVIGDSRGGHVMNEHWIPFYMHCNYCRIKYDIIGRMENFEQDLRLIMQKANLEHLLPTDKSRYHIHPSGINTVIALNHTKESTYNEKVKKYFSQLSAFQLDRLHEIYKIDFEMFGYKESDYV